MGNVHHVIYVPGLGDNHSRFQEGAVNLWRPYGITPHFLRMGWGDGEAFEPKLARITEEVDRLSRVGQVSLVGVSAGASAVLNTFAERKDEIHKIVTICGKIQNLDTVSEGRYKKNPAFRGSTDMLPASLESLSANDRRRILTLRPIWDGTVPASDAVLEGAYKKRIPMIGHAASIGATLLFGGPSIARFIKSD